MCACVRLWSTSVTWTAPWFVSSWDEPSKTFASHTICFGECLHLGTWILIFFFLSDSKTWSLQIQEQEHISFPHPNLLVLRLLKDNLQDSQFSARYQHMLAALLCCVGGGLREEFDRQGWLVSILTNVAHKVRDAAPSSRQVGRNHGLMMSFRFAFRRSHPLKASVAVCPQRKSGWNEAVLLHQQQL